MAVFLTSSRTYGAVFVAALLVNLQLVASCGMVGQVFCDKCWEGGYTSGHDSYLPGVTVSATCVVQKGGVPSNFTGSGVTDSLGNFQLTFTSTSNLFGKLTVDLAFMYALYNNLNFLGGRSSDGVLVGCQISIANAPSSCSDMAINDGACQRSRGKCNGWFPSGQLGLQQNLLNLLLADVALGVGGSKSNSLCLAPSSKPSECPAVGVTGDPHFTGADGSHFDFSGEPDSHFCIVSDAHLHINAYYGGRFGKYGDNPHKALTWIRKMGILWGHHTITLAAREGARWQYDNGYMTRMEVDGEQVVLGQAGDYATFANGAIELRWLAAKHRSADDLVDIYQVTILDELVMRLTLRPEVEILRTKDDGVVHFDFEIPQVDLSELAHGVLGQTFRKDRKDSLSKQKLVYSNLLQTEVVPGDNAEGFLDGFIADYRTSGLLKADCRVAHFVRANDRDPETSRALELASGVVVSTMEANRKMLRLSASK